MQINDYDVIADCYDIYVPAVFDIDFFVEETQKATGVVLELMSGTGRVSIPLLRHGVELTCVDLSDGLNQVLRKKLQQEGLHADVFCMDVCELDLQRRFDMVIIPFHSFAHITKPEMQQKALQRIHDHLLPGGTFICTLGNPVPRRKSIDGQMKLFRKYPLNDAGGVLLLWILEKFSPDDPQVVEASQFFEIYDAAGTMQSRRLMELNFRLTMRAEFEEMAQKAGFTILQFYGDYARHQFDPATSPSMIWVMKKA